MAIVQISRITNRKGLTVDLPAPLAGAELGWATDERRLFIGNGTLAEGAPVVGNTEILTEFSDIIAVSAAYTYQGEAAGYTVQTGPTAGNPVQQSLQSRLDSYAVVTDFGATGDGVTDDTAAINRALYQLYCRDTNPQIRRSLFFPAGVYIVTDAILIPPFASLYGEGNDSSVLYFYVENWSDASAWAQGTLVKNGANFYRAVAPVPIGTSISDTNYWSIESAPTYIARTADSLQQIGVDIATNGALPPQCVELSNMGFQTNMIMDGVLIENAERCTLRNVDVIGPLLAADLTTSTDNTVAIAWSSTPSLVCKNIIIDNCAFTGFTWGMNTEEQIAASVITNSSFDTLYQGIYLGGASPVSGGATGIRITHNNFDNIGFQGIVIEGVSLNVSGYNIFYDVGNQFLGTAYPVSSIINIDADNNVSLGDMFARTTAQVESTGQRRININNTASIGLDSAVELQLGTFTRQTGLRPTLLNNTTAVLFTVDASITRAFAFNYTITRGVNTRTGTYTVVASTDGTGGNLVFNDTGYENITPGVAFITSETGGVVTVSYNTSNTGTTATLNYSVYKLA